MRVADYIAQTVAEAGTDSVFMVAGGMMMHLMDAFSRQEGMHYYCNHHEQASAMAADAYARRTGKLGVCLATSGPGATNLLTGLVGAYQDSTPLLFITGQCKRSETIRASGIPGLRQNGFLEVDIVPIVQSVTKYAAFVDSPETARYHLEKALHLALSGRPGPVLIDVPLDVQGALFPKQTSEIYVFEPPPQSPPAQCDIDAILDRMARAKRPLVIGGHGIRCSKMVEQFRGMLEHLKVPVVTSLMAKDLLPYNHPLFVGHPGPRAERSANFAVQGADLILSMGCSLHLQTTGYEGQLFAPSAYKIQIDLDPALLQRERVGVQAKYAWDLKQYLPMFAESAKKWRVAADQRWLSACRTWKESYPVICEPHVLGEASDPVNLYEFVHELSQMLSGNETVLTDAGQPHPIMAQAFRLKESQRYLNPGSLAGMGYALPASIGAAVAEPGKTVVVVTGDGSLQTNIHELQTLVHLALNVKLFVINNDGYGSIRNTQNTFFAGHYVGSTPETGMSLPSIEKIAYAYNLPFIRCENRSEVRRSVAEALAIHGPVLCEVMAQPTQRIMPVVPSYLLADGRMRSKALHEMVPDIGKSLDEVLEEAGLDVPVECPA